jgi:hypothetical protein
MIVMMQLHGLSESMIHNDHDQLKLELQFQRNHTAKSKMTGRFFKHLSHLTINRHKHHSQTCEKYATHILRRVGR